MDAAGEVPANRPSASAESASEIALLRQELAALRAENRRLRQTEHRHIHELASLVRHAEGGPRKNPRGLIKRLRPSELKRKHWKPMRARLVSHMSPGMKQFARKMRARFF